MARRSSPARTLVVFFLGVGVMFGLVALAGSWKPALGLDLEGGTRIRLTATGDGVTSENLKEAASIIDQRVNGTGVAEAEVTTEGNQYVVVEIPGKSRRDLVETVERQAQLRFRVVAQSGVGVAQPTAAPEPSGSGVPTPSTSPGGGVLLPSETAEPSGSATAKPTKKATGKNRPPFLMADDSESADPSDTASPTEEASPTDGATDVPTDGAGAEPDVNDPLAWMNNPDAQSLAAYNAFACDNGAATPSQSVDIETGKSTPGDDPDSPLLACDDQGQKFLLSVAVVEGTDLDDASAGIPQSQVNWVVNLDFNGEGTDKFAEISRALYGTDRLFAIVLDGQVISAPTMNGLITNGKAEISGNFNQASAESLATSLRYGSLPIAFEEKPTVETIGPSLAGNQLAAGITAGLIGLGLVMLYCLFYYRGLGLVVIASLFVAAAVTYGIVLLLDTAANFTLTLPGIAGLIVAVGITADSFIVYFERIRDEMRDGKSMRVAVEAGWKRARNTCLAADAVSLLAAVVLFIFAAGVVRGFAFALGISTLIDLVVFFWFTHPMVSWLARFPLFNRGHKLSGLSAETLGIDRINLGTVNPSGTPAGQTVGEGLMGKFSRLGNDLYNGKKSINFVGRKWLWYSISAGIVLMCVLGLYLKGLNMGIEFVGGAQYRVTLENGTVDQDDADAVREAVAGTGIEGASAPIVITSGESSIIVQTKQLDTAESQEVVTTIQEAVNASPDEMSQEEIGASWGQDVAKRSMTGLVVFLVLVVLFIWAYFREWKMSVAAIVALAHDVIITVGVYAVSGFEVSPATVTGLLTILGFSLYDTVVVFDKVRENTKNLRSKRMTYAEAANLAVNQTLVRSINTSIVALIPVGAILYVGAFQLGNGSLKDLALALFVGMAAGTYSSIFIATPLLVHMKQGETANKVIEKRLTSKRRHEADRYASVPVFAEDMPVPTRGDDDDPDDDLDDLDDEAYDDTDDDEPVTQPPSRAVPTGRGRVVPQAQRPVGPSSAAGRQQPSRQARSKRGKK